MMLRRLSLLVFLVAALALAACDNFPPTPSATTPAAGDQTSEAITDAITATEPAPEPGVIVVEPADPTAPTDGTTTDEPVSGDTSATVPSAAVDITGLPATATVEVVPATPYDGSDPTSPTGLPQHIRILFAPAEAADGDAVPVMYIIPAADYAALWEAAGDAGVSGTLAGLRALAREQIEPFPEAGIPALPVEQVGNGFNDLAVQGQYVDLEHLYGLRFVGRYAQESTPVTNEGLTYVFQGFTADDEYFISFFYPVSTGALADTLDSLPSTESELFAADVASYFSERATTLNGLSTSDWSPDLALLDTVVASLEIPAPDEPADVVAVDQSPLVGPTWQWVRTVGPAGETMVADPTRYTVTFGVDGTAAIVADCNNVIAQYETTVDGGLTMTLGPSTLAACPADSQDQQFLSELGAARFSFVENGVLSIEVAEDGTTMQFMTGDDIALGLAPESAPEQPSATDFLTSGAWQWTTTSDPLGVTTVDNPSAYSIAFSPDGTATIRADCNTVLATYTATDDGAMTLQLGPTTLAACGPESRDGEFVQGLAAVVRFFGEGDSLSLEMMADGGVMSFARTEESIVVEPEGQPVDGALVGPIWQWTALRQLNGETAVPEPARYAITFNPDGRAAIQADCNVVDATYVAGVDGSLSITLGAGTLAFCGEASLDQVFLGGLGASQSYAVEGGAMTITLQLENGTMIFVPAN